MTSNAEMTALFVKYINPFLQFLAIIAGIAIIASIIVAGIQYSSSGGDPQRTAAAKSRIMNSIIALLLLIFLFGALQWLVPGGIVTSLLDTSSFAHLANASAVAEGSLIC